MYFIILWIFTQSAKTSYSISQYFAMCPCFVKGETLLLLAVVNIHYSS